MLKKYKNRDWLHDQYITKEKSGHEIAKICNCNSNTIYNWFKKFNIPIRTYSDANKIKMNKPKIREKISETMKGKRNACHRKKDKKIKEEYEL